MAFKVRSPLFSARQRSTFILFDGLKTVGQVLASTSGMGVTQEDVDYLLGQGFLELADIEVVTAPSPIAEDQQWTSSEGAIEARSERTEQQRYSEAKPLATHLTAGLGLRGFMLNLSVESAAGYTELLNLFPKIQDAVGTKAARDLERALKG